MTFYAKLALILSIFACIIALIWFYFHYENNAIRKVAYRYKDAPKAFSGFKIVHISDLHNKKYGKGQRKLLARIRDEAPDMIAVTGDLFHNEYIAHAQALMEGAAKIAPVYYVTGNHECLVEKLPAFKEHMRAIGVRVLENETVRVERNGETISVMGLSDPMSFGGVGPRVRRSRAGAELDRISGEAEGFKLLLTHRPEMFPDYLGKADLVLSGHSHAGQVRLPFVGALMTPGEGFKVKYDVGRFYDEPSGTTMIVSGGLGSSNVIPRFNNRPQLVTVEFEA